MARKRDELISLTQTEIMLILAVVVLLLLMAKDADLTRVCTDYPELCTGVLGYEPPERQQALGHEGGESGAEGEAGEESPPSDPDEEVSETLVAGGGKKQKAGLGSGGDSATTAIEVPPHLAGKEGASDGVSAANLEELRRENKGLQAENSALRRLLQAEQLKARETSNEVEREVEPEVIQEVRPGIRREIGCLPCWLGDGKPRYYYALNITYYPDEDEFLVSPHQHLEVNASPVRQSMGGELSMLSFPPSGRIDAPTLLSYSRDVIDAQRRLYGNNGCSLPVTINEEATGKTIKLIRDTAGFCPILR